MKVVIMAGGKGTRIKELNSNIPKPMIRIFEKPILEWQIESLRKQGLKEFILIIGYLGQMIKDYFEDGSRFGVTIEYIVESEPLGTAGSLYYLRNKLLDNFLLINGDVLFDININRFIEYHKRKNAVVTLFTHPNDHPFDSGVIIADSNHCVLEWLHKEDERLWYKNRVNAGIHLLSPEIFDRLTILKKADLDRDVLEPMISEGSIYVYDSPEYVKDIGTPGRFYQVVKDIELGLLLKKNLSNRQKAVFIDRDGTINKYVGFLRDINDFELIQGVAERIRRINKSGYLAIVVTNQPVIARGEVSWQELNEIHNKMETLLGYEGAYLDDIFVCPHHPDKGYEFERSEYKISCECRKPKPGMLLQAANKYNIDLEKSIMIGDSDTDQEVALAVGCSFERWPSE